MMERTKFESAAERIIVNHTDEMLRALEELAYRMGEDNSAVEAACDRFGGGDLADCWINFVAEGEL